MNIDSAVSHNFKLVVGVFALIFLLSLGIYYTSAETSKSALGGEANVGLDVPADKANNKNSVSQRKASGYKVFIDPKTGKFIETPTDTDVTATFRSQSPNSSETLVEEPAPGGGTMVVLPESFYYFSTTTIGENGKLSTGCSKHIERLNEPNPGERK